MQCLATTKSGTQCSRKAELNSNYCWQHRNYNSNNNINQTSIKTESKDDFKVILTNEAPGGELQLMLKSLQPGIMSNIISYSGTLGNFSKTFSENQQRNILKQWFKEIHIQTSFSEVKDFEIPLLWGLYQNRISNAPPKDLLDKAIEKGLNQDYFYAKVVHVPTSNFTYSLNPEDLKDASLVEEVNQELKETVKNNKLRYGDILILGAGDGYNGIKFIYNGANLILADHEFVSEDLPTVTKNFPINNFPITTYFSKGLWRVVYFDTQGTDLQLVDKYVLSKTLTPNTIYHYITTGKNSGYEIWTWEELNNWKGILPFDDANGGLDLGEDFIETIQNFAEDEEIWDILYKKITENKNLRMLFQQELYNY
jgi:hypothetical protein